MKSLLFTGLLSAILIISASPAQAGLQVNGIVSTGSACSANAARGNYSDSDSGVTSADADAGVGTIIAEAESNIADDPQLGHVHYGDSHSYSDLYAYTPSADADAMEFWVPTGAVTSQWENVGANFKIDQHFEGTAEFTHSFGGLHVAIVYIGNGKVTVTEIGNNGIQVTGIVNMTWDASNSQWKYSHAFIDRIGDVTQHSMIFHYNQATTTSEDGNGGARIDWYNFLIE